MSTREGIRFDAVSPFNEPEWEWDAPKQEGSPARVGDIAKLVRLLDRQLAERKLDTKILVTESGKTDYLIHAKTDHPSQDNQIEELFGSSSQNFIGALPHVPRLVAGHGYWTTASNDVLLGSGGWACRARTIKTGWST